MNQAVNACIMVLSALLLGSGILLTPYLGFLQFRPIRLASRVKSGGRSGLRYLCLSLGGIMGAGNIVGIAASIGFGGPGVVFWMVLGALLCAPVKYAEILIGMRHRVKTQKGYEGGAMYYMRALSGKRIYPALFCLLCIFASFTTGNMVQFNAAASAFSCTGIQKLLIAAGFAVVFLTVTFLIPDSAASFCAFAVPLMTVVYLLGCTGILFVNHKLLCKAFAAIISQALGLRQVTGGAFAAMLISARYGITAGLLSHEAGMGTSPMAHCANKDITANNAASLGIVEVYADTVISATLTALCILVTDSRTAFDAFASVYPTFGKAVVGLCLCLFALSSAVTWHYYGQQTFNFISDGKCIHVYTITFAAVIMLSFFIPTGGVYSLADISNCLLAFINTVFVLILFFKER